MSETVAAAAAGWERDAKSLRTLPLMFITAVVAVGGYMWLSTGERAREEPAAVPSTAPSADAPVDEPILASAAATSQPSPETFAAAPDAPETASPVEAPPARRSQRSPSPRSATAAAPETASAAPAAVPNDAERIESALKAGWMREAGELLMVFPKPDAGAFDAASKACRRSEAGLRGWAVPTIEQLAALRQANALPGGTWWSSSPDADERVFTLTTTESKPVAVSSAQGRAHVLCVRKR